MTGTRRLLLVSGGFVVTLGVLAGVALWPFGESGDSRTVTLRPDDPSVVASGAQIYAAQCASCHGAGLEGQPNWRERGADGKLPAPPHDRAGHTWHHADDQLFDLVKNGLPKEIAGQPYPTNMPAYAGTLSDGEIIAVLSYIKSRWPADIRRHHDDLNARMTALESGQAVVDRN